MSAPLPAPARPRRRLLWLSVTAAVLLLLVLLLWGRQTASVLLSVTALLGLVLGIVRAVRRRGWRWLATGGVALVLAVGLAPPPTDAAEGDTAQPEVAAPAPSASTTVPAPVSSASATPPVTAPTATPTPGPDAREETSGPTHVVTEDSTATEVLSVLAVKGRSAKTGYDRDLFRWNGADLDRNGCDQRNDVLARDMTEEEIRPGSHGCYVVAGMLQDRYAGTASWAERGDVDIDHAVALSNAWQTGASGWDGDTLVRFGNDPLNLVATDDALNQQKGDGDTATWLPPARDLRCQYVARQIAVKHAYQLWVTAPERDAMARILTGCPGQRMPTATDEPERMSQTMAPRPEPMSEPEPRQEPEPKQEHESSDEPEPTPEAEPSEAEPVEAEQVEEPGADVYYENCTAVREAGADPVRIGEPGYGTHLDRDGDGIGCE